MTSQTSNNQSPTTPTTRQIDAEVAEKVLGCKVTRLANGLFYCGCGGVCDFPHADGDRDSQLSGELSRYSQDISATMEVVATVRSQNWDFILSMWPNKVEAVFVRDAFNRNIITHKAEAATAPLAICLAALKAVGGRGE